MAGRGAVEALAAVLVRGCCWVEREARHNPRLQRTQGVTVWSLLGRPRLRSLPEMLVWPCAADWQPIMQPSVVVEEKLPPSVLSKASLRGNEYAWPLSEVEGAVSAAEEVGLANLGGQPQFRLPGGTCELYWLNVDAADRREGEGWSDYVSRSASEVRDAFRKLIAEVDFPAEARRFAFLAERLSRGEQVVPHLCFVLYFAEESAA